MQLLEVLVYLCICGGGSLAYSCFMYHSVLVYTLCSERFRLYMIAVGNRFNRVLYS